MLCIRHRFRQSGPIFIVCSLILTTGFLLQFHMLYTIHQKNIRLAEYNVHMNELYDTMKTVERVANRTAIMFRKLEKIVANHKAPRSKLSHTVS